MELSRRAKIIGLATLFQGGCFSDNVPRNFSGSDSDTGTEFAESSTTGEPSDTPSDETDTSEGTGSTGEASSSTGSDSATESDSETEGSTGGETQDTDSSSTSGATGGGSSTSSGSTGTTGSEGEPDTGSGTEPSPLGEICDPLDPGACTGDFTCTALRNTGTIPGYFFYECILYEGDPGGGEYGDPRETGTQSCKSGFEARGSDSFPSEICDSASCCTTLCNSDNLECPTGLTCNLYISPMDPDFYSATEYGSCQL